MGHDADRWGRRRARLSGGGLAIALGLRHRLFLVGGFGFYMLHNTVQVLATELAPSARGSALALFASCFFLGQGVGPALGGVIARWTDYETLFLGAGLLMPILGFAAAGLIRKSI